MSKEHPSNKNVWSKVGLSIGILILVVGVVGILWYKNIINFSFNSEEYTKGKIVGNVYQNKWAKLKLDIPKGYKDATPEYYSIYNKNDTDCGFYALNDNRDSIVVLFSDVNKLKNKVNAKKYLQKFAKENLYACAFAEYKKRDEGKIKIAGYKWDNISYNCSVNHRTVVQNYYSCKIDGRIATVIITGIKGNVKQNENIMKLFKKY